MSHSEQPVQSDLITAEEYIQIQNQLEDDARASMPYDPTECTFYLGALRQSLYACLTCSAEATNPIGVCYSCSIQCHSTHDIVELFTKRDFVCDCGTSRHGSACTLRPHTSHAELDIPSSSNKYNQNFDGRFCECQDTYDYTKETRNMIQCHFGEVCGEDWFHENCILGIIPDITHDSKTEMNESNESDEPQEYFPDPSSFDAFICWKCIDRYSDQFKELSLHTGIIHTKVYHITSSNLKQYGQLVSQISRNDIKALSSSVEGLDVKRAKIAELGEDHVAHKASLTFKFNFRHQIEKLIPTLSESSKLKKFLEKFEFLYTQDSVYQPPEEDENTATGSIFDMGAIALQEIPRESAIKGLEAYSQIRARLTEFLLPFAKSNTVVTETQVRDFFKRISNEPAPK